MNQYQDLPQAFSLTANKYYTDFLLFPILAVCVLYGTLLFQGSFLFVGVGILVWSFLEYAIHRFMFHRAPFKKMHDEHHKHPKDLIGISSWITVSSFIGLFTVCAFFMTIGTGAALVAGMILGYLAYINVHDRFHQLPKDSHGKVMRYLYELHASHHRGGEFNFGVTSPLWDLIFRTYKRL